MRYTRGCSRPNARAGEFDGVMVSEHGHLLKSYTELLLFGLKRIHATRDDLSSLIFAFLAPLLYLIGFEGELRTPIGRLLVANRDILRSFTYGFFKTHVTYKQLLRTILYRNLFFPVVVDVGANIGDFTLTMKTLAGKIVAVEPGKENFMALIANLRINGIKNVVPVRVAAHDQNEEVFLDGETSNMYVSGKKTGHSVRGIPMDQILHELGIVNVDVMKVDVQGHERAVLAGMHGLLRGKLVQFLIIEVHLKRGVSVDDVVSFMKGYGYRLIHKDAFLFDQPHLYFIPLQFQSTRD